MFISHRVLPCCQFWSVRSLVCKTKPIRKVECAQAVYIALLLKDKQTKTKKNRGLHWGAIDVPERAKTRWKQLVFALYIFVV